MSYCRALLALALSGLLCGMCAPMALAREGGEPHQFIGRPTSEVVTVAQGQQEFDLGPLDISCAGAKPVKGAPRTTFPAPKIVVLVKLAKCKTGELKSGGETERPSKAEFNKPLEIEYHAAGEPDAEIKNAGLITIAIPNLQCTVSWAKSTAVSDQVSYENHEETAKSTTKFPGGKQDTVRIANAFAGITWKASGGFCDNFSKGNGTAGEYVGTILAELKSGNIGWE